VKTILQIIDEAGGLPNAACISIANEPWMRLVIEVLRSGDRMATSSCPWRTTESRIRTRCATPKCFRSSEEGGRQLVRPSTSVTIMRRGTVGPAPHEAGNLQCLPRRTRDLEQFAEMWDRNLRAQGFLEAFRRRKCGQTESFENSRERR
jgi:hypothetical protein